MMGQSAHLGLATCLVLECVVLGLEVRSWVSKRVAVGDKNDIREHIMGMDARVLSVLCMLHPFDAVQAIGAWATPPPPLPARGSYEA